MMRNVAVLVLLSFVEVMPFAPAGGQPTPARQAARLAQRPARVEVSTPKAPIPVLADGKLVLVYELHVTNFGRGALSFSQLEVFDAAVGGAPLAAFGDSALNDVLQPVGGSQSQDPHRLDPGRRTIVFLWLSFPPGAPLPTSLRHRITFDLLDTADVRKDGGTQAAIDSLVVAVSREPSLVIRPPLDSGEWLMGSGASNTSPHRRAVNAVAGGAHIAERFAIDWVKIGPNGNTYQGDEHRNESYWAFDQPVHSVAAGEVVAVVDSIADHTPHAALPPVTLATIAGNYVTVRIGPNRYATYAHLKRGSTRVRPRQRVKAGDVLGLLGDTGQATAPHLHFQITDGPSVLASEGIPFVFDRFHFLGYGKDFEESKHPNERRRRQLPVDGEVIGLP